MGYSKNNKPMGGYHFESILCTNSKGETWILSSQVKTIPKPPRFRRPADERACKAKRGEFFTWDTYGKARTGCNK